MRHDFTFGHNLIDDSGHCITSVEMSISGNDTTWREVNERFVEFLRGCGYVFDHRAELVLSTD